jgi:hypothetical protein
MDEEFQGRPGPRGTLPVFAALFLVLLTEIHCSVSPAPVRHVMLR